MELSLVITFIITVIFGRILIPILKKQKIGQIVRDDGPKSHLTKMGIPTMGGIMFIIPIIGVFLLLNKFSLDMLIISITILLFALVGFLDDFIKIKRKSKDGLSVLQKTIALLMVSTFFAIYFVYYSSIGTNIIVPFSNMENLFEIPKLVYVFAIIIIMYATTNTVNLTDGVDGLATSVTTIVMAFFILISYSYINSIIVLALCLSTIGGLLAFLLYNGHPAKIFMGDTGSIALGAIVGITSIYLRIPWILLIAGIIYVIEAISVIIQVSYYKKTKKRFFKMAPIHHHFELKGWNEVKVVTIFTLVTIVACVIAYVILIVI